MFKTAASSGGAGDIVYSIPILRRLGVDILYIKATAYNSKTTLFSTLARFMERQGIKCLPTDPGYRYGKFEPLLMADFNLDQFRRQPLRGKNHIIKSYCQQFGLSTEGWNDPFLHGYTADSGYSLFHVTDRWRDASHINWKAVLESVPGKKLFMGFPEEHKDFVSRYGPIEYQPTNDIQTMFRLVQGCSALYCNQSVALTLAQGLGKKYFLERKPGKSNVLFYTQNETIL